MFRNTGANAFAKNQMRLAYEDKRDLYCMLSFYWQRIVNKIKTTYLLPVGAEHSLEIPLFDISDSVSKAENIEGLTDHFTGSDNGYWLYCR